MRWPGGGGVLVYEISFYSFFSIFQNRVLCQMLRIICFMVGTECN